MTAETVENDSQPVQSEIQDLPEKSLISLQSQLSAEDLRDMAITLELQNLSVESQTHLLEEFADYAVTHPKE